MCRLVFLCHFHLRLFMHFVFVFVLLIEIKRCGGCSPMGRFQPRLSRTGLDFNQTFHNSLSTTSFQGQHLQNKFHNTLVFLQHHFNRLKILHHKSSLIILLSNSLSILTNFLQHSRISTTSFQLQKDPRFKLSLTTLLSYSLSILTKLSTIFLSLQLLVFLLQGKKSITGHHVSLH